MTAVPRAPTTVLVLDDHDRLRRNLRALLEDEGFLVAEAGSGEEALSIVRATQIDVAIVDLRLPDMSGNEFIAVAHIVRPTLQFVIHTGTPNYSIPVELRRFGLSEESVFIKPISDANALFARLRLLGGK